MSETGRRGMGVGFLYPGHAAEDDYPSLAQTVRPPVRAEVVHTSFDEDAHRVDALSEMGAIPRLLEGARRMVARNVSSVVWSSTSASFVLGWDGARQQAASLEAALGIPASTTALAFVSSAKALKVERVAVAATYPDDIAHRFEAFLNRGGIAVCRVGSHGIVTAAEVGTLGRSAVLDMVRRYDHPDAEALLVPDTALHTVAWLEDLEAAVAKPVLTANQVTFWEALRLAACLRSQSGIGTLFRIRQPPVPASH